MGLRVQEMTGAVVGSNVTTTITYPAVVQSHPDTALPASEPSAGTGQWTREIGSADDLSFSGQRLAYAKAGILWVVVHNPTGSSQSLSYRFVQNGTSKRQNNTTVAANTYETRQFGFLCADGDDLEYRAWGSTSLVLKYVGWAATATRFYVDDPIDGVLANFTCVMGEHSLPTSAGGANPVRYTVQTSTFYHTTSAASGQNVSESSTIGPTIYCNPRTTNQGWLRVVLGDQITGSDYQTTSATQWPYYYTNAVPTTVSWRPVKIPGLST